MTFAELAVLVALSAMSGCAQHARAEQAEDRLERAVILMRHGVRAAMSTPEELQRYSVRPWPRFSVPPGHLTPKGATLVEEFGRYYRAHYQALGLLKRNDCAAVYFWANRTQRTEATARALAKGLLPECEPSIHMHVGGADPLFEAPTAGIGQPDYPKVQAAILGRMGGNPAAWSATQRATLAMLDALLLQCEQVPCPADSGQGKRRLRDTPSRVSIGNAEKLVAFTAPAAAASGITESLLMGYADGHAFEQVGWRGLTEEILTTVFGLHAAQLELRTRTPYVARVASSHLATRLLATLGARASLPYRNEAIGANEPIVVISGHDGTLIQLGGLLGIDWIAPGYAQNQAAPGGALVFEIWKRGSDGLQVLRLRYTAQSLRQLRDALPLTQSSPPLSAPIFIPGCSEAGAAFDCPLERFTTLVQSVVDPGFVRRAGQDEAVPQLN